MKLSKAQFHSRIYKIPELYFEDQRLSSFSGLIIFQAFFSKLDLKNRLKKCFEHIQCNSVIGVHVVTLILIVHLTLGFRHLREVERYKDDPLVLRALGLRRFPDVATLSRTMAVVDERSIDEIKDLNLQLILDWLGKIGIKRITLDFDGSVLSTGRYAEGTAVGFNKKKKGQRSYYPLFCTIAQTGQVLDFHHRPGNAHDSRGAGEFILKCIQSVRQALAGIKIEARLDSAFFSDEIVNLLNKEGVEFSISVPFERFPELKAVIEARRRWSRFDSRWSFFQADWSPKCWEKDFRFLFVRQKVKVQNKKPVQFDLFIPQQYGYDFKVIVTNKTVSFRKILRFHNGRGSQENIFGELKTQSQMDYIPVRTLAGNQLYLSSAMMAHNLFRGLQMETNKPHRGTTGKRSPLWIFQEAGMIRRHLLYRAGRLTKPHGKLKLTLSGNEATEKTFRHYLEALRPCA